MKCIECKNRFVNDRNIAVCLKTSYQLLDSIETHPKCPLVNIKAETKQNEHEKKNTRKVYIVQNMYGSGRLLKVFSSKEKAKESCDKENQGSAYPLYRFVESEVE